MWKPLARPRNAAVTTLALLAGLLAAPPALGHCDTADGPVVAAAKLALEKGEITPVLKWVKPDTEPEIRALFARALAVRGKGPEARALADQYFFENLVRLHRAGEGAPYTGILPAGTPIDPAVALADQALESGSADTLVKGLTHHVEEGIRERFARALTARKAAESSVGAGREFVEAYVELTHFVERLHTDSTTPAAHGGGKAPAGHAH